MFFLLYYYYSHPFSGVPGAAAMLSGHSSHGLLNPPGQTASNRLKAFSSWIRDPERGGYLPVMLPGTKVAASSKPISTRATAKTGIREAPWASKRGKFACGAAYSGRAKSSLPDLSISLLSAGYFPKWLAARSMGAPGSSLLAKMT
jgi:hypothetical protein